MAVAATAAMLLDDELLMVVDENGDDDGDGDGETTVGTEATGARRGDLVSDDERARTLSGGSVTTGEAGGAVVDGGAAKLGCNSVKHDCK